MRSRFRWANLQLSRLLNARLLLRPDISQILASLPEDLYKTYDRILDEISAAHHEYASTALRWLTLARQPLLVEELIDACSISFQDSGRPSEERRLRPLDLLNLLPNLILLEPRITSPAKRDYQRGTHYALLSHFSVKEYLLGRDMLRRLQPIFHVDAKPCHAFIASACVMYLHWTKIVKGQSLHWPLRQYAWELWAFHCVCSLRSAFPNVEAAALALFEQMAARYLDNSADDDEARPLSTAFDRLISELPHSADRTQVLEALFRPYFVNEYFGESLYAPINTYGQPSIRIVEVLPSFHWFAPVRCLLTTYTMETSPSYETVSYLWGSMDTPKYAWINSHPVHVRPTLSKLLRGLRDAENTRRLWIDAVSDPEASYHLLPFDKSLMAWTYVIDVIHHFGPMLTICVDLY